MATRVWIPHPQGVPYGWNREVAMAPVLSAPTEGQEIVIHRCGPGVPVQQAVRCTCPGATTFLLPGDCYGVGLADRTAAACGEM